MENTVRKENKMGVLPIPKLLFQMSLPMMISMLVQALYNVVDSVFVAMINEEALTAVSLVFPIQNLMIAIAVGTAVGVNALLSRNLGEKDFESANQAAKNGIFLSLVSFIVFAVFGTLFAGPFFHVQTGEGLIKEYGIQYMTVISVCSFGCFLQMMMDRLLQSTGRTLLTMFTQGTGAIVNLILDPILIFGLFGFPKLGVAGAAIATVAGQILAMCLGIYFNVKKNTEINISMKKFRPSLTTIGKIYTVGLPTIIMQAIGSVMTFGFNKILLMFTPTATAVFGVYFKLNSFVFMPVFGLNNGMVPIIAYNYGARNQKRILSTIKLSAITAVCLMFIGLAAFMFIPDLLLGLFSASPDMLAIGVPALRTICLSFLFAGYCIVISSAFQALGNGVYSLIVSLCRQLLVLLPSAFLLAKLGGLNAVWWSFPIAEIASLIMSTFFFRKIYKTKILSLGLPKTQEAEA
ncbi:MAG: MATE family efflux transporter [Blautia sp.]|jgi:putative MATE family efflux protein